MDKLLEVKLVCTELLLIPFEGYAKRLPNGDCIAYPDPGPTGLPITIGYGSTFDDTGKPVELGEIWSYEKAIRVKKNVLNKYLSTLLSMSPGLVNEPIERIAAILSWCYNCGFGSYRVSTFKKKIDKKDWLAASQQCLLWDKAKGKRLKGLTLRRQAEAILIIKPKS